MFVTIAGNGVFVRLSRRNLCQLNAIIDSADASHRFLTRQGENGVSLVLQVEDDADHYEERTPCADQSQA
jgi:hypothetical protein